MRARVRDIAEAAGVSKTTVLRALWDKEGILPETKERIKELAKQMNYRPNYVARSLVMGSSNLIGVVASEMISPVFDQVITPISQHIRAAGYSMLFHTLEPGVEHETECLREFLYTRVAGVIALPGFGYNDYTAYSDLVDAGIKLVVVFNRQEEIRAPQVVANAYEQCRLPTDFLIALGHRKIAHLVMPLTSSTARERHRGYTEALTDAGLVVDDSLVLEVGLSAESGNEATERLLAMKDPPTAIIARHDVVAMGAMHAVFAAGLSVPDHVSVIGGNDIWSSRITRPALTTVYHGVELIVEQGVRTLLAMLEGGEVDPVTVLDCGRMIIRDSAGPPRSTSKHLSRKLT